MESRTKSFAISLLILTVGMSSFACKTEQIQSSTATLNNHEFLDQCTTDMATRFHIHSHLTIMANGERITIPEEIGIKSDCMSSVHTHNETGIIHIESPIEKEFILGDFFYNWNEPLSANQVLDFKTDLNHGLKMFVNGRESTDFENLILEDDQEIFIDYYLLTKGPDPIPEPYDFEAENL